MSVNGYLSEFSLPELFQFLEQGQKTGLLSINALLLDKTPVGKSYYIWLRDGRIIAAANQLDGSGLMSLIKQRKWHNEETLAKMGALCPVGSAWGLCLKSQGLLEADHLKILFSVQVLRQVCNLFTLEEGFFSFDANVPLSLQEMTGLSTPANEVTLSGLRALKNWTALINKLPAPSSGLLSMIEGQPKLSLNQDEWKIWEFTKGNITIEAMAKQLDMPLEKLQQISFRLMVIGLVEEIPMLELIYEDNNSPLSLNSDDDSDIVETELDNIDMEEKNTSKIDHGISKSFLDGLMGFLNNNYQH